MRTILLTVLFALLTAPAAAQTTDAELRRLVERAARAINNPGNQADRDAAANGLRHAIRALEQNQAVVPEDRSRRSHKRRRTGDAHVERCIDIGFAAYNKAYDERNSLNRAVEQCRPGLDANLLQMKFDAESKSYDDRVAFERAVTFSRREDLHGKSNLVQLAFDEYRKAYDARAALDMAAKWAAPLRRRDESCIRRAHVVHSKSYDSRAALRMAVQTCSQ